LAVKLLLFSKEEEFIMYKRLLTIGFIAGLAACTRDSKVQQATTTPVLDYQGRQIGEATSPAPTAAPVNLTATSTTPAPVETVPQPVTPPQPAANVQPTRPAAVPEPAPAIAIPAGTQVRVRLEQTISTKRNQPGDRFEATLISPIRVDGNLLVPRGTTFVGHVTEAKPSGRFKGRAELGMRLDSFRLNGAVYQVATATDTRVSGRHRKRNWILMGGGSGAGAGIGAIAGGGPGALIGAGAGAGAGAVGAFFTGRKNVTLPVETPLTFQLRRDVALAGG
jgi:hypothetical protein